MIQQTDGKTTDIKNKANLSGISSFIYKVKKMKYKLKYETKYIVYKVYEFSKANKI
jgi:hypothetical protein